MTDRKQRLAALADRVEQLQRPDIHVDADIRDTLRLPSDYAADWRGWGFDETGKPIERAKAYPYTASLDAALTLTLPNRRPALIQQPAGDWECVMLTLGDDNSDPCIVENIATPALALCAAALRAQSETVA